MFLDDLYRLLEDDATPAMEAEDITDDVNNTMKSLPGGNTASDPVKSDSDISLNTDDILGIKEDPNGGTPENNDSKSNGGSAGEDQPDQGNGDDTDETEETPPEEDQKTPEDVMSEQADPFSENQKKILWSNFKSFYSTLTDAIELVSKYVPNISDAETIRAMDDIKENLTNAKQIVFDILTVEYKSMDYPSMKKKYVGLNQIYDLCTKELETYFDKYRKE